MKFYILLFSLFLTVTAGLFAQPQLKLSAMRYDYGSIVWKQPAKAVFQITNSGKSNLVIEDVHPDCGCTLVDWTKGNIRPGDMGTIEVTYDAELLGHFVKQLRVTTNESSVPFYLTVSGDVVMEKKDYSKQYAYQIGDLYLDSDNVEFDDVRKGDYPFKTLTIFNAGRQSYKPEVMHLPPYLSIECEPKVIQPGRKGQMSIILNSDLLRSMGLTQTNIYLSRFPGDRISRDNEILLSATLLPEIKLTEAEMLNAPVAHLDSTTLNLGQFGKKSKLSAKIHLVNTGKSTLNVSALQVYNPGINASIGDSKIEPGKKSTLKVTVYADRHHFKGRRRVLLITNDPKNPKVTIDIIVKK